MWRSVLVALVISAYGHPAFDGYRPEALDRPFQAFFQEVEKAAFQGKVAMQSIDEQRATRYVKIVADKFEAEIKASASNLPNLKASDNTDGTAAVVTSND
jgi:hypothetical protein